MKLLRFTAKLGVSLVFFALIFRVVSGEAFAGLLAEVRLAYVALSILVSLVMIGVSCLKWHVLLAHQQTPVGYGSLFRLYLIGYYFTSLLPSNVGGDVARSYYAGRRIGSQSAAAVSVFIERVSGLVLLLLLVVVAPMLHGGGYTHPAVWVPAAGAIVLLGLLGALLRTRQPLKRLLDAAEAWRERGGGRVAAGIERILSRVREKLLGFHRKLKAALKALRRDRHVLVPVAALTVLFYALTWLNVWISFRAFGVGVPPAEVVALTPTCMMVAMLPIAPLASLGLAEGAYVYYFGLAGVSAASALAMGLLLRCKLLLIGLAGLVSHLTLRDRGHPAGSSI